MSTPVNTVNVDAWVEDCNLDVTLWSSSKSSAGYALMLRVIADMRRVPELGEATSSESPSESTSPASPTTAASSSSLSSSSSLPRRQRSGHQRLGILRKGPLEAAGGRAALAQHLLVWHAARTSPVSTAALSLGNGGPSRCQCFSTKSCLIDPRPRPRGYAELLRGQIYLFS